MLKQLVWYEDEGIFRELAWRRDEGAMCVVWAVTENRTVVPGSLTFTGIAEAGALARSGAKNTGTLQEIVERTYERLVEKNPCVDEYRRASHYFVPDFYAHPSEEKTEGPFTVIFFSEKARI